MRIKPSLNRTLKQFEDTLNQNKINKNIHYQAGYLNQSYYGSYFYVNRIEKIDDTTTEGFLVTILQSNGDTETFDILNHNQYQIIKKFKNKLYHEFRIGRTAKNRNN